MAISKQLRHGLCGTALAALLVAAPLQFALDLGGDVLALKGKAVFARGGGDDGGSSGRGGGGDSSGGGDHGGSSGRGGGDAGGDDHGGNSGHGGDNGDDDDHGGSSGHGSDDRGGGDDQGDSSGRGSGDDRGGEDRTSHGDMKVESEGDKIEVTFPDGTKQEIENGRFEQKNAAGRTIVERPATRADFERLRGAAAAPGAPIGRVSSHSDGSKVEVSGRDIEVRHADGWKEEIQNDRYEMKDANDNTVVERAATSEDRSRLEGLADF